MQRALLNQLNNIAFVQEEEDDVENDEEKGLPLEACCLEAILDNALLEAFNAEREDLPQLREKMNKRIEEILRKEKAAAELR